MLDIAIAHESIRILIKAFYEYIICIVWVVLRNFIGITMTIVNDIGNCYNKIADVFNAGTYTFRRNY